MARHHAVHGWHDAASCRQDKGPGVFRSRGLVRAARCSGDLDATTARKLRINRQVSLARKQQSFEPGQLADDFLGKGGAFPHQADCIEVFQCSYGFFARRKRRCENLHVSQLLQYRPIGTVLRALFPVIAYGDARLSCHSQTPESEKPLSDQICPRRSLGGSP